LYGGATEVGHVGGDVFDFVQGIYDGQGDSLYSGEAVDCLFSESEFQEIDTVV
jgi:hypothetical protein